MPTDTKEIVDLRFNRQETLCLAGRLEPPHLPFLLTRMLM